LTKIDRVRAAIEHREPDKVPKGELAIADELIRSLLDKEGPVTFEDQVTVRELLCMDVVSFSVRVPGSPLLTPLPAGKTLKEIERTSAYTIYKDIWGNEIKYTGDSSHILKHPLEDIQTLDSYKFPSLSEFETSHYTKWAQETDFFVFGFVGGGFDNAYSLTGFSNFFYQMMNHKQKLEELIKLMTTFNASLAKKIISAGAHGIVIGDDLAYNEALLCSPRLLREIYFPYLQQEVHQIKKCGVPVFFHSDGNLNEVIEDIVNCGIDGLHSLQPSAHMDLGAVKRKYGKRICLMGNIDLFDVLTKKGTGRVAKAVQEAIDVAAEGGGYILSSSNMLTKDVLPENARVMYRVAEEYGVY